MKISLLFRFSCSLCWLRVTYLVIHFVFTVIFPESASPLLWHTRVYPKVSGLSR